MAAKAGTAPKPSADQRGEQKDAPIERYIDRDREWCRQIHRGQRLSAPECDRQTAKDTRGGQDAVLGEQLANQPAPRCPERLPDGQLRSTSGRPRQDQVGNVDADDAEHQGHHGHQSTEHDRQRLIEFGMERGRRVDGHGRLLTGRLPGVLPKLTPDGVELGLRAREVDAGLQPANQG